MSGRPLLQIATVVAAVGCGVAGGVFFAFSAFVMRALDGVRPAVAVSAMQSINRSAVTAPFMILLFGAALICVVLGVVGVASWGRAGARWLVGGAAIYLGGVIAVTIAANVPRNHALAAAAPTAETWAAFAPGWTTWNHVRSAAAIAASLAFVLAVST